MKKILIALTGLFLIAGCSKTAEYSQDLTGQWIIYKLTYKNVDITYRSSAGDSLRDGRYNILFTADGKFVEQYYGNPASPDTAFNAGTWSFQKQNGQLQLVDSINKTRNFTIFNLQGNSVELLKDGYDRYMRKIQ
jgi:hypothetical protein